MWSTQIVPVWSKIRALSANKGDHTTRLQAVKYIFKFLLCHKKTATVAKPSGPPCAGTCGFFLYIIEEV